MGAAVETIEEVFRTAIRRHQAGDIEGAAELYTQILREAPHHPGAWHLLGLVYFARRDFQAALLHIERALSYCDSKAVYWNNYGAVLKELGRIREAQLAFEKALAIHHGYADAWSNLGETWDTAGAPGSARLVIHDGAILRVRTDSNNDGEIDDADDHLVVKNSPDTPGRVVLINSDDDDQSGMADKWERPEYFDQVDNSYAFSSSVPPEWTVTVANEDDLAPAELSVWLDSLTPQNPAQPVEVDIYVLAPIDLVLWSDPTKGVHIHRGSDSNGDGRIDENTRLHTMVEGETSWSTTIYVEANHARMGVRDRNRYIRRTSGNGEIYRISLFRYFTTFHNTTVKSVCRH